MKKNIAEILKYCREGLPLWSPAFGNVELKRATDTEVVIRTKCGHLQLNVDGKIHADGECMLFPSKEQRDWDKFCSYEDGDVLRTFIVEIRYPEHDKMSNAESYLQGLIEGDLVEDEVGRWCVNVKEVPYIAIEKEGRIWDPVKKELENIEIVAAKAEKFDINTLKPFDRVLVRDYDNQHWTGNFFLCITDTDNSKLCDCIFSTWYQCIPYEGNEKLLFTTEKPDEYYITWEEEK